MVDKVLFLEKYFWLIKIILGIVVLIILQLILPYVLKTLKKQSESSNGDKHKEFYKIFYNPLKVLIWIFILSFIFSVIALKFEFSKFLIYINKTRNLAIILDLAWILIKWKNKIKSSVFSKSKKLVDKHSLEFVSKIITVIIFFITSLWSLQVIGLNIMPLMAFSSIGAAAIGFAAKDAIANFFGGLMLYINRPFVIGDLVDIPSQNIIGHIECIGWYNTRIRELQKIPIYVPNNIFSNVLIKNKSRRSHRRLEEIIKIKYSDFEKILPLIEEIKTYISQNKHFDKAFEPYVFFTDFNDFSLDILVKAYTFITNEREFYELRHHVLLFIESILKKYDAQIPYPTTSVEFLNK